MRLISCHIDGFGKLIDFDIDFEKSLFQRKEENGWGKSTLLSFIRIMLFGFDTVRGNEVNNEKKRYEPWGEAKSYGGSLTFSFREREYIIERTFGTGRNKKDSLTVYDAKTNLIVDEFSERPGEDIFGVNSESFQRSIFIGQSDVVTYPTSGIQAKIGGIGNQMEDLGDFEKKDRMLHDILNSLSPSRKTGRLSKLDSEIAALYGKESEKETLLQVLRDKGKELYSLKLKKEEAEKEARAILSQMKEASKYKDMELLFEKKQGIEKRKKEVIIEMEAKKERFKKGIPGEKEVLEELHKLEESLKLKEAARLYELSEEEKEKKESLSRKFFKGCPTDEDLELQKERILEWRSLKARRRERELSKDERENYDKVSLRFKNDEPSEEEIETVIREHLEGTQLKNLLPSLKEKLQSFTEEEKQSKKKRSLFIFLSLAFLVSGVALFFIEKYFGVGFASIGFIGLILGASLFKGKKEERELLLKEILRLEEAILVKKEILTTFFSRFNEIYEEEKALSFLYQLKTELDSFYAMRERANEEERLLGEENLLSVEIEEVFRSFGSHDFKEKGMEVSLRELEFDKHSYLSLIKKEENRLETERKIRNLQKEVLDFLEKYGMEKEEELKIQLRDVLSILSELKNLKERLEVLLKEEEEFKENHKDIENVEFFKFPKVDLINLEKLNQKQEEVLQKIDGFKEELAILEVEVSKTERSLKEVDALILEKEEKERERKELGHRYEIIEKTRAFLKEAKEKFLIKYRNPIKENFDKYYNMIAKDDKVYELDVDLNLQLKEMGKRKDLALLSTGYQDLVGFCRRLSMVMAMYDEEKPFLILDDPFVNLDEKRLQGGLRLLKELEKEHQILYFYCHESRKA